MPIKTASPQDTYDHMFGSGATSYSWWLGTKTTGVDMTAWKAGDDWSVEVTADDGNDGETTVTVDHAAVLKAARQVIKAQPQYSSDALLRECKHLIFDNDETDFDANSADELLQVIVLGQIIFG
jgi:hypothetical protein